MNTKSVDFAPVRKLGKTMSANRKELSFAEPKRWSPNRWLYFVLFFLFVACLAFATIVWSILLSPLA